MDWTTSSVVGNVTIDSKLSSQLSDVALGGIIGSAVVCLILFFVVTIATVNFFHRRRRVKLESPETPDKTFTYVRQVNLKEANWTLPPGSDSTLTETPTLPVSRLINPIQVEHCKSTTDRLILPDIACHDPDKEASFSISEVVARRSPEAEVVVEKQTQNRKCRSTPEVEELDEPEPQSETGSRIELKPNGVLGIGSGDNLEPMEVPETGSRDTQSVNSFNLSLSEDYCNRVIDEAFGAIDNFAYSDYQSDTE